MATVAAYGPNTTLATKLVVSILQHPTRLRDHLAARTWTTEAVDVRRDPTIAADVSAFLREHGVKDTVTADRIIGCPHQEGIDYPMGRACPRCPFWSGIDRFTHEPVDVPAPALPASDVLSALAGDDFDAVEAAVEAADAHRDVLVEPLLQSIETCLADPRGVAPEQLTLCSYALYILAKWREPRAYPTIVRWLSLPGEGPFEVAGDVVTQDGARILAAVCDGNLEPIERLILDEHANEWGRGVALYALALLAAWTEVPRESVVSRLLWLATEGLERTPSQVWNELATACADIEALEVFPAIRRAYDDGLVDPFSMDPSELDDVECERRGDTIEDTRERVPPIADVLEETSWWSVPNEDDEDEPDGGFDLDDDDSDEADGSLDDEGALVDPIEPYVAPPKIGRNEPCHCGSGKKFKRCCGD